MQAGELRERVTLLTLAEQDGIYSYQPEKTVFAAAESSERGTILSGLGMGARAAEMTFRAADAPDLMQVLRWRGKTYVVSTVLPDLRLWTKVMAAQAELRTAKVKDGPEFQAVLLEKYIRWASEKPMDTTAESYLMLTPKEIELQAADILTIEGIGVFHITVCHRLDPAKNEYEILREVEL